MDVVRVRPRTAHPWVVYTHYASPYLELTLCGRVRAGRRVTDDEPSPPPLCPRCETRLTRLEGRPQEGVTG